MAPGFIDAALEDSRFMRGIREAGILDYLPLFAQLRRSK